MQTAKSVPVVLAVAAASRNRQRIREELAPDLTVNAVLPAALADPVPHLDAAAAVAVLDATSDESTLAELAGLAALPAGRALVLVLDGPPEAIVSSALAKLLPAQVLTAPAAGHLLRWAVSQAMPSDAPGTGAREGQRPATTLLGVSSAIRGVMEQIRQIAPTHISALILGETGTGKELVARAVHEQSDRAGGPFVAVNCGALPDSLLESELFGHARGAFTGAERDKRGLFEHASGGTLFLDEIGDTSPALQMKLLRVLESKEIRRLGETRDICVDVRVVSATHQDLERGIEEGTFRQDLFYRLNTVTLHVPPLRRRRVDIPFLAQHFAEEFGAAHARRITLSEDFLDLVARREFPGNVRELRNAVERAIALAGPGSNVTSAHLDPARPDHLIAPADWSGTLKDLVDRVESDAIRAALTRCDDNRSRAAASLGLTRPGLRYKMRRLGLEPSAPDSQPERLT
ncbi:MAG: sigma 54-interacting transcriptional regulator [Deltaproteobacteria bacterium]|nr:sigma 54-interacting transcriptional regulator [Deltaproteobacteria bacterium]